MFKDYYQILGILPNASKQEVKQAYRSMSLKWHPDKNPNVDVTTIMQDINEAYKILNDDISRARYDREYQLFIKQPSNQHDSKAESESRSWDYDYEVKDEDLKNDINEARSYAKDLVDEFLKNLKETSKVAVKGAWERAYPYLLGGFLFSIIVLFIRSCQ